MPLQEADVAMSQMANMAAAPDPLMQTGRLWVHFETRPVKDEEASAKEGRPKFKPAEYIKIITPGDKDNVIHREVMESDKIRWPKEYEAFKAGKDEQTEGTPLSAWPVMTSEQVEELRYFKIFTVEQLADLRDDLAQKFAGINSLRVRARDFLALAKDTSVATKMRADLEARDQRIAALEKQIEDLGKKMDEQGKKNGR